MITAPLIAGIELGGTKCICILARGPDAIVAEERIPTTVPDETLGAIEAVLDRWQGFAALGIASFGPVSLDRSASDYGYVTASPKPGWSHVDIAQRLAKRFAVPTGFHTDVTGAAVESLEGPNAVAIVYTNTTSTSPLTKNVPALKYLSYRLIMKRDNGRWLVTRMTTITSLDLTPHL